MSQRTEHYHCDYGIDVPESLIGRMINDVSRLKEILDRSPDRLRLKTFGGMGLLHLAARSNASNAFHFLVAQGLDFNEVDSTGRCPFAYAIEHNSSDLINFFIRLHEEQPQQLLSKDKSALILAANGGCNELLAMLVRDGHDPNQSDRSGKTPLFYAANRGNAEAVAFLLKNKALPFLLTAEQETLLHAAVRGGLLGLVYKLLSEGHHPFPVNAGGLSPLLIAISKKNVKIVDALLKYGACDEFSSATGTKLRLLWKSVTQCNSEVLSRLLAAGIFGEWTESNQSTYFLAAACLCESERYVEKLLEIHSDKDNLDLAIRLMNELGSLRISKPMLSLLLDHGADPSQLTLDHIIGMDHSKELAGSIIEADEEDPDEEDPDEEDSRYEMFLDLESAFVTGDLGLFDFLTTKLEIDPLEVFMFWVVTNSETFDVRKLTQTALGYCQDDKSRKSLLNQAFWEAASHLRVVEVNELIACGADVNATDECDRTALHRAIVRLDYEAICMLLERGASATCCGSLGFTPLHYLRESVVEDNDRVFDRARLKSIVDTLRQHGATYDQFIAALLGDVDFLKSKVGDELLNPMPDGSTVLHWSAIGGNLDVLNYLLQSEVDVDKQDINGNTALSYACRIGRDSVIRSLLEAGSDPTLPNHNNKTPLNECVRHTGLEWVDSYVPKAISPPENRDKKQKILQSNWLELEVIAAQCKDCDDLLEGRRIPLTGRGKKTADLMFVIPSPTLEDEESRTLLTGERERLFDRYIKALGIGSNDYYIAAATQCVPRCNDKPTARSRYQCEKFLRRQIDLVDPKVILCLGWNSMFGEHAVRYDGSRASAIFWSGRSVINCAYSIDDTLKAEDQVRLDRIKRVMLAAGRLAINILDKEDHL